MSRIGELGRMLAYLTMIQSIAPAQGVAILGQYDQWIASLSFSLVISDWCRYTPRVKVATTGGRMVAAWLPVFTAYISTAETAQLALGDTDSIALRLSEVVHHHTKTQLCSSNALLLLTAGVKCIHSMLVIQSPDDRVTSKSMGQRYRSVQHTRRFSPQGRFYMPKANIEGKPEFRTTCQRLCVSEQMLDVTC